MAITPKARPGQSFAKSWGILRANGVDTNKPAILAMRGYFRDSMGAPGANDRGMYDDAIFIVTPTEHKSFMGNTDPSRYRLGYGTAEATKGMAELHPGVWMYKRGMHRASSPTGHMALVQAEEVLVIRDGRPDYKAVGWFGINIHRGGNGTTSSLGCQTIPPSQWTEFYAMITRVMAASNMREIPYCLVEQQG